MQQLTGVNAYISQMGLITSAFNIGFGNYVPAIMGFVQWFSALISMYYLYRFQRRKMLLIGNLGTSLCSYIIGITFFFIQTFDNGFWIVVTSIILFMGFNGIFLIPSVPLYLPTVGTKVQLQYTQVTNWFSCGTAVILLPIIDSYFGFSPMFITFGTISLIFFLINLFFMIDTKPDVKKSINDQIKEY
jgi:SP family arabinose:H+ symporter-like MFS transporter/SP family xylose:H+ symportor-like MFS transporter